MSDYFGDFAEDETVYIPFNTFDSNDPSASVTITNLAAADIKVHKDGSATEIVTDGATITIDFDSITGNHLIVIDTSVDAAYTTAADYMVRIEGTTVDAANINAWVGSFSIENRFMRGTDLAALATALATAQTDLDTITGSDGVTLATAQGLYAPNVVVPPSVAQFDARTILSAAYFDPAADTVNALVQGFLSTTLTESTGGRINDNFEFFYDNSDAQTTQVVDDVGGGGGGGTDWTASERNEIRGRIGITGTTASGGNTPTLALEATVAGLNDLSAAQVNTECDTALTDYDGPTNAEMIARTLLTASYFDPTADPVANVTLVATTTTNTDMRGTEGANTTVPDAAGVAPTAIENRQEMDSNSTQLAAIVLDTGTTLPAQINSFTIPKNATYSNFMFLMVLTSDGRTPATGLTVTGQRSIDAGSFQNVGGTIAEVSNGIYQFDALAADTNGDLIVWRFSAATADDTFERLQTI